MGNREDYQRGSIRDRPPQRSSGPRHGFTPTAKELSWYYINCARCKEDVVGMSYRPEECPFCGGHLMERTSLPFPVAMDRLEELKGRPYWERKRAWKWDLLFGKKST